MTVAVPGRREATDRLALVYRGPASVPGCPEAVAELLLRSGHGFTVRYAGPQEEYDLTAGVLARATVYAQPGGGSLRRAHRKLRPHGAAIRDFVAAGGRYLGFCLGAYLAGRSPGFGLLPGDTDQYVRSAGATVSGTGDVVIPVRWREAERQVYFQDGPCFLLDPGARSATVLATYDNGMPAALVASHGQGAVGVVGPHPEATADWFTDVGLRPPQPLATDLGLDLVDEVMRA